MSTAAPTKYKVTTLRLIEDEAKTASEWLKARGMSLTQYVNLSIVKLNDMRDLPFVQAKNPSKVFTDESFKRIDDLITKHKIPTLPSLTNEEIDEIICSEI
jgi:hypothetical protein